jgi:rhomboid family GlyGly-CTERM serine protease
LIFLAIIVLLNWSLFLGEVPLRWVFHAQGLMEGEWWRLVTHPFVHVSWYHLLLDAGAFLLLYEGLRQPAWFRRLVYVIASGAGALAVCWLASPDFSQTGLCGLSGVAHGLMAIAGMELALDRQSTRGQRRAGWITLAVVVMKAGWEMLTGQVAFQWLHFGLMGTPLAASHAGGVLGGLAMVFLQTRSARNCRLKTAFTAGDRRLPQS